MVKTMMKPLILGLALALASTGMVIAQTAPGTVVTNTISLSYNTGAGDITVANAAQETFTVDRKIDLRLASTLAPSAEVTAPGGTAQAVLRFTLTNRGNGTQDFQIAATLPTTPTSTLTLTQSATATLTPASGEFSLATSTDGTLANATALTGNIDNLAANGVVNLLIIANIPVNAADNLFRDFTLTATALTEAGGAITFTRSNGLDGENVIATDTASNSTLTPATQVSVATDGIDADQARLRVASPVLQATKTVAVISENPAFACTNIAATADASSSTAGAIPGACLEYTISIQNTSANGASATALVITDILPSQVTFRSVSTAITYTGTAGGATTTAPANNAGTVTATIGTLPAGTTAEFKIRVTVN